MDDTRLHELFRTIDSRDWSSLRGFLHPDVVYARPGYPPFEGIERVLAFYESERVIASGTHSLRSVVMSGKHGACCGRFVGTHRDGTAIDEADGEPASGAAAQPRRLAVLAVLADAWASAVTRDRIVGLI